MELRVPLVFHTSGMSFLEEMWRVIPFPAAVSTSALQATRWFSTMPVITSGGLGSDSRVTESQGVMSSANTVLPA